MADNTAIEWTHRAGTTGETWNPIVGCSIHSPGCTNCYAMTMAARIEAIDAAAGRAGHYVGTTKKVKGKPVWTGKIGVAPDHIFTAPLRRRAPRTVFVNSMSDLFHEDVPDAVIDRVFAVMALSPQHTFQVLTKRSARMREYVSGFTCDGPRRFNVADAAARLMNDGENTHDAVAYAPWPLPNVWLGVSTEDQKRADERIPHLLATPAAIRFVSAEPLLGPIDFLKIPGGGAFKQATSVIGAMTNTGWHHVGLHWVIVGGESGTGARPMHPAWARAIRDQCAAAGVAYFHKQNGAWRVVYDRDRDDPDWRRCGTVAAETPQGRWLNMAGGHGFHGERVVRVVPATKKAAGRLLDGVAHNGFPEIAR